MVGMITGDVIREEKHTTTVLDHNGEVVKEIVTVNKKPISDTVRKDYIKMMLEMHGAFKNPDMPGGTTNIQNNFITVDPTTLSDEQLDRVIEQAEQQKQIQGK